MSARRKRLEWKRYLRRRILAGKPVSDVDIFYFFPVREWWLMIERKYPMRFKSYTRTVQEENERQRLLSMIERLGSSGWSVITQPLGPPESPLYEHTIKLRE